MEKSPTFIDLFCGAGGLSKGLTSSGFKLLWAIDYDVYDYPIFDCNGSLCYDVISGVHCENSPILNE